MSFAVLIIPEAVRVEVARCQREQMLFFIHRGLQNAR